jgi:hypothetical protein
LLVNYTVDLLETARCQWAFSVDEVSGLLFIFISPLLLVNHAIKFYLISALINGKKLTTNKQTNKQTNNEAKNGPRVRETEGKKWSDGTVKVCCG